MKIFDLFEKNENKTTETATVEAATEQPKQTEQTKQTETPLPEGTKRVHNLIILDESGSMISIYDAALSGVNETLQTIRGAQKEHPNQQHFVSLITFDSSHYNSIYSNTPAEKAVDITKEQYHPDACTPLYDAMGRAINELRSHVEEEDVVLVTVITDGYENASREFNCKTIRSLVEALKQQGWVFTYIGANQDVEAVAKSLSIDNHLAFEADDVDTRRMFQKESYSRKRFFGKLDLCDMDRIEFSKNYFEEDDMLQ